MCEEITKGWKGKNVHHGDVILTFGEPNTVIYTIKDPVGIHARPAGAIVKLAKQYHSDITFCTGAKNVKANSILSLMSLGAAQGTKLKIKAQGEDANEALAALLAYMREHL